MRITKTFCDLCEKECDQVRFGVVSGCVLKMNPQGQLGRMVFEGHYCEDDVSKIIDFIEKSKNAENTNTPSVVKPIGERPTGGDTEQ